MKTIKLFIVPLYFFLFVTSVRAATSINLTHTSPDTITVTGQFSGENCYNLGKPLPGGIVLSSRGGTPDGVINLDLSQAKISATLNGAAVSGSPQLTMPLSTVHDLFLITDPQLTLTQTDIVRLTVTGAKVKTPGEVGLEIGYGNPDPRGSVEMFCAWDSLGQGGQHIRVGYVYPSPKPSPIPSPTPSNTPINLASSAPTSTIAPSAFAQPSAKMEPAKIITQIRSIFTKITDFLKKFI